MPQLELRYFNTNGRAGGMRLLLDYLKVPFSDVYVTDEEWPEVKKLQPFRMLPVLVVDNKYEIAQTTAIFRYIGAKFGAIAETLEEQAVCDSYGEHLNDLFYKGRAYFKAKSLGASEEKQNETREEFQKFFTVNFIPAYAKQLKKSDGKFVVGNKVTWLDFFLADFTELASNMLMEFLSPELKEDFVVFQNHRDRIFALPGLENRLVERKTIKGNVIYKGNPDNYEPYIFMFKF